MAKADLQERRSARNPRYAGRLEKRQGRQDRRDRRKEGRQLAMDQGTFGQMARQGVRKDIEKMGGEGVISDAQVRQAKATGKEEVGRAIEASQDQRGAMAMGDAKEKQLSPAEIANITAGHVADQNLEITKWEEEREEEFRQQVKADTHRQQDINRQVAMHAFDTLAGSEEGEGGGAESGILQKLGQLASFLG